MKTLLHTLLLSTLLTANSLDLGEAAGNNAASSTLAAGFALFTLGSVCKSKGSSVEAQKEEFEAEQVDNKVLTTWTAQESIRNTVVERSKDGIDWEVVTQSKGTETPLPGIECQTTDEHPYMGISFYRLKRIDADGNQSFSETRAIALNGLTYTELMAYPNPTTGRITITGTGENLKQIITTDADGEDVSASVNTIGSNEDLIVLDLSALSAGTYYLLTEKTTSKIRKE